MASTASTNKYDIKVENTGPARIKVTINVSAETISAKLQESMGALKNQVQLPGFRKGKIPPHILERKFGESIRSEARNEIFSEAWQVAREEHDLKPIGEPEPVGDVEDLKIEEGKAIEFALEVEVMPQIELPAFDAIELKRPVIEVKDSHIKEEIERQAIRHGSLEDGTSKAKEDDYLIGPATVHLNGSDDVFYKDEQVRLRVPAQDGSGQVLGLHIDDLGKILAGVEVGDEIKIKTTGPDEHELEDVRGAKVEVTFNVVQIVHIVPLTIEELQKEFGLDDENMMKEQIRAALEHRRDQDQAAILRKQATEAVSSQVEIDLPEKMTALQADRDLQRMRTELQSTGKMTLEQVEEEVAKSRTSSAEDSKNRMKIFFILAKLAEHFHVSVGEHEINARIAEIAMQNGVRPEEMRNTLAQQGQLQQIQAVLREEKAADQLVAACSVSDVSLEEWQASEGLSSKPTKSKTVQKSASKKKTTKKKSKKKTSSKS